MQNKCMTEMNGNGHISPLKPGSNGSGVSSSPVLINGLSPGRDTTPIAFEAHTLAMTFACAYP